MHYLSSTTISFLLAALPSSLALPANPSSLADAGVLSPAEWARVEALTDRRVHFEIDPKNPMLNIAKQNPAGDVLHNSGIKVQECIDPVKGSLINDELASARRVLSEALAMKETHPVWGNLTYVANVVDNDPNPLQRTKDLFQAAIDLIDGSGDLQNMTFTCESDAQVCSHVTDKNGTSYSVTSTLDATTGTVKLCDAFFALPPQLYKSCSSNAPLNTYKTRTGTILHELFHYLGTSAKAAKDRSRELFDLLGYDYENVASLARGTCKNSNYPNLPCDPNYTLVNIDTMKWAATGYYWYETCRGQNETLALH